MSFLLPKPKSPPPPKPAPPPPTRSDAEVQAAAAMQRRKYGGYGGRSETMLTGGLGASLGAGAKTQLLGGGSL